MVSLRDSLEGKQMHVEEILEEEQPSSWSAQGSQEESAVRKSLMYSSLYTGKRICISLSL